MKEYKVRIVVKEFYECYVEAKDEKQAEDMAYTKFHKGVVEMTHDNITYEVEDA